MPHIAFPSVPVTPSKGLMVSSNKNNTIPPHCSPDSIAESTRELTTYIGAHTFHGRHRCRGAMGNEKLDPVNNVNSLLSSDAPAEEARPRLLVAANGQPPSTERRVDTRVATRLKTACLQSHNEQFSLISRLVCMIAVTAITSILSTTEIATAALDCAPLKPTSPVDTAVSNHIRTTTGTQFNPRSGDVEQAYEKAQRDTLFKYPRADIIVIRQMSGYFLCTILDSSNLSDEAKLHSYERLIDRWSQDDSATKVISAGPLDILQAARSDDAIKAKALIAGGTDVNGTDSNNNTPLMLAAQMGNESVLALLLSNANVEVNRKNSVGQTALALATQNQRLN